MWTQMIFVTTFAFDWLLLSFALSRDNDIDHQTNYILGWKWTPYFLWYHFLCRHCFFLLFFFFFTTKWNDPDIIQLAACLDFVYWRFIPWLKWGFGFSQAVNQHVSWHLVLCFPFQSNTCITCYEPTALLLTSHWSLVRLTNGVCPAQTISQTLLTLAWPFPPNITFNFCSCDWFFFFFGAVVLEMLVRISWEYVP